MDINERAGGIGNLGISPYEGDNGSRGYVQEFEERLATLQPLSDRQGMARAFALDKMNLIPEKFTSAILWHHNGVWDILIGSGAESGYKQMDHDKILNENDLLFDQHNTILSFVMTVKDQKFLLVNMNLRFFKNDARELLIGDLSRYGLLAAFSEELADQQRTSGYATRDDMESQIVINQRTIDNLINDDWISQVAEAYGWTNTELLRFRLNGEYPRRQNAPRLIMGE